MPWKFRRVDAQEPDSFARAADRITVGDATANKRLCIFGNRRGGDLFPLSMKGEIADRATKQDCDGECGGYLTREGHSRSVAPFGQARWYGRAFPLRTLGLMGARRPHSLLIDLRELKIDKRLR